MHVSKAERMQQAEFDFQKSMLGMQINAQNFAVSQASITQQAQIAANLAVGLEGLDTKLQVAKLDFTDKMTEEADRHQEAMGEIDVARHQANSVDTSNFLT